MMDSWKYRSLVFQKWWRMCSRVCENSMTKALFFLCKRVDSKKKWQVFAFSFVKGRHYKVKCLVKLYFLFLSFMGRLPEVTFFCIYFFSMSWWIFPSHHIISHFLWNHGLTLPKPCFSFDPSMHAFAFYLTFFSFTFHLHFSHFPLCPLAFLYFSFNPLNFFFF